MANNLTYATAIHILTILASRDGDWVTSEGMARSVQTNPGLVRRVLSQLSVAALVETKAGSQGGARLAKPMHLINLAEVYEAVVQQPVLKTSSREPNKICEISCGIGNVLEGVFSDAERAMRNQLKQTTIKDVLKQL
ncbi:MAG: Rrf2 family transcriptional regulator [Chloroflexota bacterium]